MDYSENKLLTKKNIATLLLLAILMLAIPFGVQLAQKTQVFAPKAASDPITFSGDGLSCAGAVCTTTRPAVTIQITSTLGPPQ